MVKLKDPLSIFGLLLLEVALSCGAGMSTARSFIVTGV